MISLRFILIKLRPGVDSFLPLGLLSQIRDFGTHCVTTSGFPSGVPCPVGHAHLSMQNLNHDPLPVMKI